MKRTIRDNMNSPYSLHDMNVISFEAIDHDIIMRTQSGIVEKPHLLTDNSTDILNSTMSSGILVMCTCLVLQEMLVYSQARKCF